MDIDDAQKSIYLNDSDRVSDWYLLAQSILIQQKLAPLKDFNALTKGALPDTSYLHITRNHAGCV